MRKEYKDQVADKIAARYIGLEERILQDIARRIKKTGEITSTADWQINRLRILGYSSEDIEREIKKTLDASYPEMFELYDKVIDWEYVRNKDIYEQINAEFIPYEENRQLQQITDAIIQQSLEDLENVTRSLGFYLDYNGRKVLTPLSQVYTNYLDNACFDIVTGAFDYGSVLRRVVTQLTNSGLRKIEYGSGYASRVEVAARRAVMTGVANLTGEIADYNAKKLGTEYFEVEWHAGARPTHAVWQGQVWTKEQLYSVCGLGTVTGLLGANCYHTYYPFFPGISERNWSDDWLEEQNRKESKPKEFRGKEYVIIDGQQYIADRVVEKDGVFGIERNIREIHTNTKTMNNSEEYPGWNKVEGVSDTVYYNENPTGDSRKLTFISNFTQASFLQNSKRTNNILYFIKNIIGYSQSELIAKAIDVDMYIRLQDAIFEPLPGDIQAKLRTLVTNYPVTNISVTSDQLDGYTVFNYPISMANGWNYVKQQLNDNRDYIYDMDIQSAEAYVNSEYAVALTELEVM